MKSLTSLSAIKWSLLFNFTLFATVSCRKDVNPKQQEEVLTPAFNSISNKTKGESEKIYVNDVSQLYAAINDAANAGKTIVLAAGTYVLNASYPNDGRLELLENMQLLGQPGHPEEVIIDASALPGTSFIPPLNFPLPRTGAIRMGRGLNAIEWLTVKGNASTQALSVIDTDLIWAGVSQIRVAHCVVTGGRQGIDIRNPGVAGINRILEAELTENEIFGNVVQQGQGIEVQNSNGASDATIRATLNGNYVHDNHVGLRTFNNNANNINTNSGSISIESHADRFEENGIGIYLNAALNQGATSTANDNVLVFEAHGTTIKNSTGAVPSEPSPSCGIYLAGANTLSTGEASNNRLTMNLWGCSISGNQGAADIIAFGAISATSNLAGINNVVEIQLQGVSKQATDLSTASLPTESAGTNRVNIFR